MLSDALLVRLERSAVGGDLLVSQRGIISALFWFNSLFLLIVWLRHVHTSSESSTSYCKGNITQIKRKWLLLNSRSRLGVNFLWKLGNRTLYLSGYVCVLAALSCPLGHQKSFCIILRPTWGVSVQGIPYQGNQRQCTNGTIRRCLLVRSLWV